MKMNTAPIASRTAPAAIRGKCWPPKQGIPVPAQLPPERHANSRVRPLNTGVWRGWMVSETVTRSSCQEQVCTMAQHKTHGREGKDGAAAGGGGFQHDICRAIVLISNGRRTMNSGCNCPKLDPTNPCPKPPLPPRATHKQNNEPHTLMGIAPACRSL